MKLLFVCSGNICRSPMAEALAKRELERRDFPAVVTSAGTLGIFGEPEDLNGTVLFLLSDLSSFITGICIPVDGGYSAYGGV